MRRIKFHFVTTTILAGAFASGATLAQTGGGPAPDTTINPPAADVTTESKPEQAGAAQGAAAGVKSQSSGGLEDIVVTARRTSEKLQTTPVAVTALSNQALLTKQVVQVADLQRAAPSVSIGTGGAGPSTLVQIAIRGQAQNSPNSVSDAAVGIYIDGVYVARPIVGNLGFLDVGSAEVLRGPQGTLFGRNTTGGALNVTTAQPTDALEGYVKAGLGNFESRLAEAVMNIPLTSEVAARFSGRFDQHDGYFPNVLGTNSLGGVKHDYYGRGTVKWAPSSLPIVLAITGDYTDYRDTGNAVVASAINPDGPLAQLYGLAQAQQAGLIPVGPPIGDFRSFLFFNNGGPISQYVNKAFATGPTLSNNPYAVYNFYKTGDPEIDIPANISKAGSVTANLTAELDGVTVKSITGWRKSNTSISSDLTSTPTAAVAMISDYRQHQFSEELQASSTVGHLDYIFGAIYFREAGTERTDSAIFYLPAGAYNRGFSDFVSSSKGAFAQLNYHVTDALRVTGGFRYTFDNRSINRHGLVDFRTAGTPAAICGVGPNAGQSPATAPCNDPKSAKFSYPAWLASIDYRMTPDIFLYAKTSGASLSGGFNVRNVPPPYVPSFDPEDIRDVEIGVKAEFLNNRVRMNLDGFYQWQSNVQRFVNATYTDGFGNLQSTQFVTNAGKVHSYGLEAELTVVPWKGMTIDANGAYLHARYVKGSRFEDQLVPVLDGAGNPTGATQVVSVDRSGEQVAQAPKWTASIGLTQVIETKRLGKFTIHGDYSYISDRAWDTFTSGDTRPSVQAATAIQNKFAVLPGYGLLNAAATYALPDSGLEFSLWGRNIANKTTFTYAYGGYLGLGLDFQGVGAPRTYGGTVSYRF